MKLLHPFFERSEHIEIELPGARVLFTTRRGGFSDGPYASLNLGRWTDDDAYAVQRNRESLEAGLGVRLAYGRQVHGTTVRRLISGALGGTAPHRADGQATALPGIAPMVLVADCLPVAIAGQDAVAIVHAGWRGLAAGVLAEGVRAVRELGAREPLAAAIGPGAGRCCYEVGAEVHALFSEHGGARKGRNLDLKAIARSELGAAGVATVHDAELCTICGDRSLFYSHRRDRGVTGRQAGIAWLS